MSVKSSEYTPGRRYMLQRAVQELHEGMVVNLGIGLPSEVVNLIPSHMKLWIHSENGLVGLGPKALSDNIDPNLTAASSEPATFVPGAACFDTLTSFAIIRGGHLDLTMLGGLQIDQMGRLANWMIPGKKLPGMGGAMDLVAKAKHVVVLMEHTLKDGSHKIVPECQFPLSSIRTIDKVITDLGVIEFHNGKANLTEISPHSSREEIRTKTGIPLY